MTRYFVFANPHIDKFPATPMPSGYNTPAPTTPQLSRAPSIEHPEGRPTLHVEVQPREGDTHRIDLTTNEDNNTTLEGTSSRSVRAMASFRTASSKGREGISISSPPLTPTTTSHHHHSDHHHHHHRHRTHSHTHQHGPHLHSALLHLSLGRKREEGIVGMFESQRYMNLEAKMHDPCAEHYTQLLTELLREWYSTSNQSLRYDFYSFFWIAVVMTFSLLPGKVWQVFETGWER